MASPSPRLSVDVCKASPSLFLPRAIPRGTTARCCWRCAAVKTRRVVLLALWRPLLDHQRGPRGQGAVPLEQSQLSAGEERPLPISVPPHPTPDQQYGRDQGSIVVDSFPMLHVLGSQHLLRRSMSTQDPGAHGLLQPWSRSITALMVPLEP